MFCFCFSKNKKKKSGKEKQVPSDNPLIEKKDHKKFDDEIRSPD